MSGGLIGGLASGLGSLFTIGAQKRSATRAFKRQKELFDYQNAYNTPANQMKRLKDAGLNPALMYGQGNTGNATGFAGVAKADVSGPQLAQSVATGAQMSLLNSQKKLNEANAGYQAIAGAVKAGEYGIAKEMSKYQMDNLSASTSKMTQEVENLRSQKGLTDQNILNQKTVNALNNEYLKNEKKGMHKGNMLASVMKIFNLDMTKAEDRLIAQSVIGALVGSQVFKNLAPGLQSIFRKTGSITEKYDYTGSHMSTVIKK